MNKQKQGKANRAKGHNLERVVCKILRERGYTAETARYASRKHDDLGCDVMTSAPLSIQCKASTRLSVPVHDLLKQMAANGLDNPAVVHQRPNKGMVISMTLEDLLEIIEL